MNILSTVVTPLSSLLMSLITPWLTFHMQCSPLPSNFPFTSPQKKYIVTTILYFMCYNAWFLVFVFFKRYAEGTSNIISRCRWWFHLLKQSLDLVQQLHTFLWLSSQYHAISTLLRVQFLNNLHKWRRPLKICVLQPLGQMIHCLSWNPLIITHKDMGNQVEDQQSLGTNNPCGDLNGAFLNVQSRF